MNAARLVGGRFAEGPKPMSDSIHSWLPSRELRPRPEGVRRVAALGKMLHHLLEAIYDAISAQREYERLTSMGVGHDSALKAALSEMAYCREAGAHRASVRSAFHVRGAPSVRGLTAGESARGHRGSTSTCLAMSASSAQDDANEIARARRSG